MKEHFLDFERPLAEIIEKIEALQAASNEDPELLGQIEKLRKEEEKLKNKIFSKLSTWQKVQVARHPQRPHTSDYIKAVFSDFIELHGDRQFADDQSIIGGIAEIEGNSVMVIGHEKGRETEDKVKRNFGMPQPEGYRKAKRLMQLAERFNLPVITFIDTAGAYPGIEGEERGQSEAIATNLAVMSKLKTPIIVIITGEGGSGGALAIGVGDHIAILEHATYSVASPEACASIIWRTAEKASDAAEAMKVSAQELIKINESIRTHPIEMIGKASVYGTGTVWMTGSERSNLAELFNKTLVKKQMEIYPDPYPKLALFYRSDNISFAKLGVPAHTFSSSPMENNNDYHQSTDTVSTLNFPAMYSVIKTLAIASQQLIDAKITPDRIAKITATKKGKIF